MYYFWYEHGILKINYHKENIMYLIQLSCCSMSSDDDPVKLKINHKTTLTI